VSLPQTRALLPSLLGAARVTLPAALLGIAVVCLCERVPLGRPLGARGILVHVAGSVGYPTLWIGSVNITNNLLTGSLAGSPPRWRFPPEHIVHWHYFTGALIYVALAAVTYARRHVLEAERRRLHAEWKLLRGQLNPHFLFNTLHSVFGLAQVDPSAGEQAMTRFSRLMRFALTVHREDRDYVTLVDEWAFTENYLHLEALRLESRLRWKARIAHDVADCAVPAMLLQPLVENAVRHGAERSANGCTIVVAADACGADVRIRVSDDGPGTRADTVATSRGIGLRAARARVGAVTMRADGFVVETAPGRGFVATIHLPRRQLAAAPVAPRAAAIVA
jgi:anti-sigma regulatory factor (Ser/Thr protein kinase)